MGKINMFISDENRLGLLLKTLRLDITKQQLDELYQHIDYTRKMSFKITKECLK